MSKLTKQEQQRLADALDLLKRASADELREALHEQDGEDERIATVEAVYRLQAHAVDITSNMIVAEQQHTLREADALAESFADSANRLSEDELDKYRHELHRLYYAALHCLATSYSVESYHRNHDYIPQDVALHMLDKVVKGRRMFSRSDYDELEQGLVNDFLNL